MNEITKKGEYDNTPFNIIQQSEILTLDDIKSLEPLKNELKETFVKVQGFRTRTEMEVSVLNDIKFPTPASKYWQAVREQNVMFNELVMLSYEYRKNLIEIKKLELQVKDEKNELDRQLLQIEIERKIFISKQQEKIAKERIREIKAWSEIKDREIEQMDPIEADEVDNHQLISYTKRWIKQSVLAGDNGSPAERQNLEGQLVTGIRQCIEKGLLEEVLNGFSTEIQNKIKLSFNLK